MLKALVCGGRHFDDARYLARFLDACQNGQRPISAVIHGDCRGADRLAGAWAARRGICEIKVPAHWDFYDKPAGHIRNSWMMQFCAPDVVIAFRGSRGTQDMIGLAEKNFVKVIKTWEVFQ